MSAESQSESVPVESGTVALSDTQLLSLFLSTREHACPLCGYNLRGLTSPRCPECGRALALTIGVTEPYLRAWVTLLVPLCASAGMGMFCAFAVAVGGWPTESSWRGIVRSATIVYFISSLPVTAAAVFMRRRLLRRSRVAQWLAAITAWVLAALGFAGFLGQMIRG